MSPVNPPVGWAQLYGATPSMVWHHVFPATGYSSCGRFETVWQGLLPEPPDGAKRCGRCTNADRQEVPRG